MRPVTLFGGHILSPRSAMFHPISNVEPVLESTNWALSFDSLHDLSYPWETFFQKKFIVHNSMGRYCYNIQYYNKGLKYGESTYSMHTQVVWKYVVLIFFSFFQLLVCISISVSRVYTYLYIWTSIRINLVLCME